MPTMTDRFAIAAPSTFVARKSEAKAGSVTALVSAYETKYRIGYSTYHTIRANAFADSIAAQPSIPIFWAPAWNYSEQPPIGHGSASEGDAGLEIDGELYIDADPEIGRIHSAMMVGALREWSIGYQVLAEEKDPDDDMHSYVTKAELLEASIVLRGANPATETLRVASAIMGRDLTSEELARLELGAPLAAAPSAPAVEDPAPPAPDPNAVAASWAGLHALRKLNGTRRSE